MRLHLSRVTTGDSEHKAPERHFADLNHQMYVVCHPAIGMNTRIKPADDVFNDDFQPLPMFIAEKDILAMIPP